MEITMSKNFSGGISSLISNGAQPEKQKAEKPKATTREITKTSQEGTKENETRATFIVNEEVLEKVKAIAYWERLNIKEVVGDALNEFIQRYEKKNGAIQPVQK